VTISGNILVQKMLGRAVKDQRLHHALLFYGPPGIGKYSVALDIARKVNCLEHPGQGCETCEYCRRMTPPFPIHPDVSLLRNAGESFMLRRQEILDRFCSELEIPPRKSGNRLEEDYDSAIDLLKSLGVIKSGQKNCGTVKRIDTVRLDPDVCKTLTPGDAEGNRLSAWLFKKLSAYAGIVFYRGTIKIEHIRSIQSSLAFHPYEARSKFVIIDNAENMGLPAQHCILKTLEEPPGNSHLVLVTSNPFALLPTIRSRCQPVPFRRLSQELLSELLTAKFGFSGEDAFALSSLSEGRVEKALSNEWSAFKERIAIFSGFFRDIGDVSAGDWAVCCTDAILSPENITVNDDESGMLNDFFRWLHDLLLEGVSNRNSFSSLSLPGNQTLGVSRLIYLINQIAAVNADKLYHIDLRLRLESIFIQTAQLSKRMD
jgi:DNA polymerase III delta prime subunit